MVEKYLTKTKSVYSELPLIMLFSGGFKEGARGACPPNCNIIVYFKIPLF